MKRAAHLPRAIDPLTGQLLEVHRWWNRPQRVVRRRSPPPTGKPRVLLDLDPRLLSRELTVELVPAHATGLAHATDPIEVAEVIHHAITTDEPTLRYAMSWGGKELVEGRAVMDDDDWVAIGELQDDSDYYLRFKELFDLDISPR